VAEEHAVEIELEDIVLAVILLQPEGEQPLLHLALERLRRRQEKVLGDLLGDGRGAARHLARLHALEGHRGEAQDIDAEVLLEAAILDGDERRRHVIGELAQRDRLAAGLAAVGDELAVRGEHPDVRRPLGYGPGLRGGELHEVVDDDARHGDRRPDAEHHSPVEELADDPTQG
jgi:hypothetical protein